MGLKRARELKKQAAERRKIAAEQPEKAAQMESAYKAVEAADEKSVKHGENGKISSANERKAFRTSQDGQVVDPWRRFVFFVDIFVLC